MTDQDMYKQLAKYYDKIYHWKDYKAESEELKRIINRYKKSNGNALLDVACGTGAHLRFFTDSYNCTGIDLNSEMLEVAKQNGIKAEFVHQNMAELNLGKSFDVITCLFSSIGYLLTEDDVKQTIKRMASHLKPGGVLLIEPWLTKEIYRRGSPHMTTYDGEDLKIARLNISELEGNISVFKMHYLIAESNKPVKYIVDHHKLAMFPHSFFIQVMEENELEVKVLKEGLFKGRGLFLGVKK